MYTHGQHTVLICESMCAYAVPGQQIMLFLKQSCFHVPEMVNNSIVYAQVSGLQYFCFGSASFGSLHLKDY
jgi:hypothetical protein